MAHKQEKLNNPLYIIFEQHLCEFHDVNIDRKTFIANIVAEYLKLLRSQKIGIPPALEKPIVEELALEVNTYLVKKIYGFYSISEFQKVISSEQKQVAQKKYQALKSTSKKTA